MSTQHTFIDKFDHPTTQRILRRLIEEPTLVERFHKYIRPEDFIGHDKSPARKAYAKILNILLDLYRTGRIKMVTAQGMRAEAAKLSDDEQNEATKKMIYHITEKLDESDYNDDHILTAFLDSIKISEIIKWYESDFRPHIQRQRVDEAVNSMSYFLPELEKIKISHEAPFSFDDVEDILSQEFLTEQNCLIFGVPQIDDELQGGFFEQTLNGFMAVSGGGKSMMTSQLVALCVKQKKYAHVVSVEESKRTFLARIFAAITGIPSKRLLNGIQLLNDGEKELVARAKEQLKQYVTLEFMYESSLDQIHRHKSDKIEKRKRDGLPRYEVDILDYTGHLVASCAGDKMYEKMLEGYKARKNFVLKHNLIGFDFVQPNRDGTKKNDDDGILRATDIAGGFDIIRVFDNLFSINRSAKNVADNTAVLYVDKARNGDLKGKKYEVPTEFDRGRYNLEAAICLNHISGI